MTRQTALPSYTVAFKRLDGAPYDTTTIRVNGVVIRSQLGRMSDDEVRAHVTAYINPAPVRPFSLKPVRAKSGPKPKRSASVNARGFLWSDE